MAQPASDQHQEATTNNSKLPVMALAALGVVYGDIGTSPLYTLKECFGKALGLVPNQDNILGILSLILWGLILVVSSKYLLFVLRADNNGEGGILTLLALTRRVITSRTAWLLSLALMGAGFFYGEVVITPAISVISAIEGIGLVAPSLESYVVPITLVVLIGLFSFQHKGTAKVGKIFGPIMLIWFGTLGILGIMGISNSPQVLAAFNPYWAVNFMLEHKLQGFLTLGAVVLALTGAEALYADMGHFGRSPIRLAWYFYVLPALMLNYLGQGALLLEHPEAKNNPFFQLVPDTLRIPMVLLATIATVIASQAVISGVYSLTRQAINMGYLPRMPVRYTSEEESGQIYIGFINWLLLIAVIFVVLGFQSSEALAGAYGIAVTGTMIITTILSCTIARRQWHWPLFVAAGLGILLLLIDIPLFAANVVKIVAGGWLPLLIGAMTFVIMTTWFRGRFLVHQRINEEAMDFTELQQHLEETPPAMVEGTAIFMTHAKNGVPHALLHNLKHNHVLHGRNIFLSVQTDDVPLVPNEEKITIEQLSAHFWRVSARFGFREHADIRRVLVLMNRQDMEIELEETSFFLSQGRLLQTERPGMVFWRESLFILLSRNSLRATDFFRIPPGRVVEMGAQIEL
ncbi:potassium transporter Kup [Pokkaliibacter sp. CJK22405]|uniref:potassium transporter Kup n=1 Tax=Pokkaliibacter sp. CJK22405 TaxID=3384615 RepID=UPI0039848DB6